PWATPTGSFAGAWRRWPPWASWTGPTTARRPGGSPTPSGPAWTATRSCGEAGRPPRAPRGWAPATPTPPRAGAAPAPGWGGDVAGTELEPAGLVATVDGAAAEVSLDDDLTAKGVILTDLPTAL